MVLKQASILARSLLPLSAPDSAPALLLPLVSLLALPLLLSACTAVPRATAPVSDSQPVSTTQPNSGDVEAAQRELLAAKQLRKSGDLKGAEERSKSALSLFEKAYGADSLQVTESLEVLIASSCAQGQCADMEGYWRRMLALREKHLGSNDPTTIATVCQLGEVCEQKHKPAEAKSLYLRALSIRESEKSFLVSPTLIALARLESTQGSRAAALAYLERAEQIEQANASPVNLRAQIAKMRASLSVRR